MARRSGVLLRQLLGNQSTAALLHYHNISPNPLQTLTLNSIPSASKSFSTFPLDFHYEDVLRQDMLLKMNYDNVMQVPRLCELKLLSKAPEIGKIAMEISGGQKFLTQKDKDLTAKGFRGANLVSHRARQTTLRSFGMSNFLVRSLTVMSLLSSPVQIRKNFIQFSMETEFIESSPELEDHFEIFEQIKGFNVTIVTSASTKDEASLLWSGFLQKDEIAD
ncbi:large ribosomal subunit protein uL5m [Rosa sericea]